MKVGDLVKHRITAHREGLKYLEDWIGIVVSFDADDDPCVHWYDKGTQLYDNPTWEFKSAVEKI
jgi:hypothetical protein